MRELPIKSVEKEGTSVTNKSSCPDKFGQEAWNDCRWQKHTKSLTGFKPLP